jgi:hypothetical protein
MCHRACTNWPETLPHDVTDVGQTWDKRPVSTIVLGVLDTVYLCHANAREPVAALRRP